MNQQQKKKIQRRLAAVFAVMIIIAVSFVCCGARKSSPAEDEAGTSAVEYAGTEEYVVQAFDTLSDIAVKYIPSDEYMQQWICDVIRLNGRRNSTIYYGETIRVYTYEKKISPVQEH